MLKNKKKVNDILHRQRQHPKKCRSLCCNTQNPFKCSIVRRWGIEDKMKTKKNCCGHFTLPLRWSNYNVESHLLVVSPSPNRAGLCTLPPPPPPLLTWIKSKVIHSHNLIERSVVIGEEKRLISSFFFISSFLSFHELFRCFWSEFHLFLFLVIGMIEFVQLADIQ